MAVDCRWLHRTIEPGRPDPYVMLCQHIVREGENCIGPFLEDVETDCGLWTPNDEAARRAGRQVLGRG